MSTCGLITFQSKTALQCTSKPGVLRSSLDLLSVNRISMPIVTFMSTDMRNVKYEPKYKRSYEQSTNLSDYICGYISGQQTWVITYAVAKPVNKSKWLHYHLYLKNCNQSCNRSFPCCFYMQGWCCLKSNVSLFIQF